ncbi:MAG: hypothetical protein ACLS9H_02315 [Dialister sp.]
MYTVLSSLGAIAVIMFFVSLVNPKWGSFGQCPDIKRWKLALIWFVIGGALGWAGSAFMTDDDKKELQARNDAPYVEILEKGMNTDKAVATKNWDILSKSGFKKITEVKASSDNKYSVDFPHLDASVAYIYTNNDKNIEKVEYHNKALYENGEVKGDLKDHYITDAESRDAFALAKKTVKKDLKDPDSAKFDDNYIAMKNDGIIDISGKVRAKNSFNAMVLSTWGMRINTKTHKITDYYLQ